MLSATRRAAVTAIVAAGLLALSAMAATSAGATTQTTGPTPPTNLTGNLEFGPGEWELHWSPSTDPVTPQSQIRYRVYQDGVEQRYEDTVGLTESWVFGGMNEPFTVYVVAEDKAGLLSKPSNVITCQMEHLTKSGQYVGPGCS